MNPQVPIRELSDADSDLGDAAEAASLLLSLSQGGLDTQSATSSSWHEALRSLPPSDSRNMSVHVDHLTINVREDRVKFEDTQSQNNLKEL